MSNQAVWTRGVKILEKRAATEKCAHHSAPCLPLEHLPGPRKTWHRMLRSQAHEVRKATVKAKVTLAHSTEWVYRIQCV